MDYSHGLMRSYTARTVLGKQRTLKRGTGKNKKRRYIDKAPKTTSRKLVERVTWKYKSTGKMCKYYATRRRLKIHAQRLNENNNWIFTKKK